MTATTAHPKLNIIARKPRSAGSEYIVVDRGDRWSSRFVVATATPDSLACGEWFWGYYFNKENEALDFFNSRGVRDVPGPDNHKS